MYLFINALILALLVPVSGSNTAGAGSCRAELNGLSLLTIVELPTGVAVEGPWRVTHQGSEKDGAKKFTLLATLDHVIEKDALTGNRSVIPFPKPVRLAFEGDTQEEVVRRAARMWCVTVMRAQENQALDYLTEPTQTRITALPHSTNAG